MLHKIKIVTSRDELKKKVLYFAVTSRLFVLFLSFVFNILLPDHNADAFKLPHSPINHSSFSDKLVQLFLGGLSRWDAQYFLHISLYGYTYENSLAFFPLFPFLTRTLAFTIQLILGSILNFTSVVLISAVILNFIFFVKAATTLFELSCLILKDIKLAYVSALLFCVSPASIFFTAPYSEACFSFFTFSGMLFSVRNENQLLSSLAFGLSGLTRSNGLLSFGFIIHKILKRICHSFISSTTILNIIPFAGIQMLELSIYSLIIVAPFLMFQVYAYQLFCINEDNAPDFLKSFGESKGYVLPGSHTSTWCNHSVPFSYSYVQSQHWNVGFLKYYELKQIPNFLLASPLIYLIFNNSYLFMKQNIHAFTFLGLSNIKFVKYQNQTLRPEMLVFVVHALSLTCFCLFFIHVQVTTRMIASTCPVLYWLVTLRYWCRETDYHSSDKLNQKFTLIETEHNMQSFWRTCILTEHSPSIWFYTVRFYFILYLVLGTVLFSNFYPWT